MTSDYSIAVYALTEPRAAGTPLAYLIGQEEFMGIERIVSWGAFAPRTDTGLLCNEAIDEIRTPVINCPRIIDIYCS